MRRIVVSAGSMRKGRNTDLLAQAFAEGASKNNTVEIVSVADYKVNPCIGCDRLHTPMRNEFQVKKLALLLVGAATLPELFDAIKLQYQLVLNFFHLEDAGMVLVRGVKDIGDIQGTKALDEAYNLGNSINDEMSSNLENKALEG